MSFRFSDRKVEYANRWKVNELGEDIVELDRYEGEVYEEGTPINSETLNTVIDEVFNALSEGLTKDEVIKLINEQINDRIIEDNSVTTSKIQDNAVVPSKIQGEYENYVETIENDKTIDITTGELIDNKGSYVTNFIKIKDENGDIHPNLYVNKWKEDLLWVGYDNDRTTVINFGNGDASVVDLCYKVNFENVYYVRFIGYSDICRSDLFVVSNQEYKYLKWLRLTEENYLEQIGMENVRNCVARIRETQVFKVKIKDGIATLKALRGALAYINNVDKRICYSGDTDSINLSDQTTYAIIYDVSQKATKIVEYKSISYKCIIFAYIYYYNKNTVKVALLGNDNSISVYNNDIRIFDAETEESIFNNYPNKASAVWNDWSTVKVDKLVAPVPFVFNSSIYAKNGMFVAKAGLTNTWNSYDNGKGGHIVQLFANDKSYRGTLILDDRIDSLPIIALQSWITTGKGHMSFGWTHLGADSCGFVDEVSIGKETGIYVNPKVSIFNTPTIMKPQPLITNMPMQYQMNDNGDYVLDENGGKIPVIGESIENKNVLQVNENNDLCYHRADTNKWYKINMTEITE